jgi:predicted enzyme related to lactoylglutathione lyase
MAQTTVTLTNKPAWIELSSLDAAASRDFYARLFGWEIDISEDPQYGGYGIARIGEQSVAGIGPKQSPETPTAWGVYIGTDDVDALTKQVEAAGGTALMAPFDVGDQGRMAVYADPSGAVISAWQATAMRNFVADAPNALGWVELNAREVDKAIAFYTSVFGWTTKVSDIPGQAPYTEFQVDGESIAGATEMNPQMSANIPSYWMVYFNVTDVDGAYQKAIGLGATEMMEPQEYPGGRFAILSDPHGASFGLLRSSQR